MLERRVDMKFKVGDVCEIVQNNTLHDFEVGDNVKITALPEFSGRAYTCIIATGKDPNDWRYCHEDDLKEISPTVDNKPTKTAYDYYYEFIDAKGSDPQVALIKACQALVERDTEVEEWKRIARREAAAVSDLETRRNYL
jgi:hypothetical protein